MVRRHDTPTQLCVTDLEQSLDVVVATLEHIDADGEPVGDLHPVQQPHCPIEIAVGDQHLALAIGVLEVTDLVPVRRPDREIGVGVDHQLNFRPKLLEPGVISVNCH